MEYKDYIGTFTFNEKLELFQGRISNIKDLITFQGKSMEALEYAFKDSINEYISWCKKNGKDPEKPSQKEKLFYYGP
jgi:predicted HicB family RNase H-like nuclease